MARFAAGLESLQSSQGRALMALAVLVTAREHNQQYNWTINEPAAAGAYQALKAAGKENAVTIVSVDGGCPGVEAVKAGQLGATSQQYPVRMAEQGVAAVAQIARGGEKPNTSDGLDFFNTGVALVTDNPVDGVDSIDTTQGAALCWGAK